MKRLLCVLCMMFCLTGCISTGMQIKGDSELSAVAEIAARRIGHFVAQNEKANIETITKYVDLLLTQDDDQLQAMALYGLRYLSTKYTGDPLLADDLLTVIRLLGVDLSLDRIDLDGGDLKTLRVFAEAFRKGLSVTKNKVGYNFSKEAQETDTKLLEEIKAIREIKLNISQQRKIQGGFKMEYLMVDYIEDMLILQYLKV